ncbi:MAG: hypothetical protein IT452_04325 [Planctomycetia bacterium]|nr:hypothetical protein [Planctomycetia bacterium]
MRRLISSRPAWRRRPDYFPSGQDILEEFEARLRVAERHGVLDLYLRRLQTCTVQHRTSYFGELAVVRFLEEQAGFEVSKVQEGDAQIEFETRVLGQQVLTEVKVPGWQGQFAEDWRTGRGTSLIAKSASKSRLTKAQVRRLRHPYKFLPSDGVRTLPRGDALRRIIDNAEAKFQGRWPRLVMLCDDLWMSRTGVALLAGDALLNDRDQDSNGLPIERGLFRRKDPHWLDCVGFLWADRPNRYDFRMIVNDRSPRSELFRRGFGKWYRPGFPDEGWNDPS